MTKILLPSFKAIILNFLQLINYTYLVVCNVLPTLFIFEVSFFSINFIFALLKDRKSILKITSILIIPTKKVF